MHGWASVYAHLAYCAWLNMVVCATHCRLNFDPAMRLVLAGTIQFAASLQAAREQLAPDYASLRVPQSRPLSPGACRRHSSPFICPWSRGLPGWCTWLSRSLKAFRFREQAGCC